MVAKFLMLKGQFAAGLGMLTRCAQAAKQLYPPDHSKMQEMLFSVAEGYGLNYDLEEQKGLLEEILSAQTTRCSFATGSDLLETTAALSKTLSALSELHRKVGEYDQALKCIEVLSSL